MRIWFTKQGLQIEEAKQDFKNITEGINHYYGKMVDIEDELTLEEFFDCLAPFFKIIDRDFVSYNKGVSIKEFYKEIKKKATKNPDIEDVECIEFSKNITVHSSYDNESTSEDELEEGEDDVISWLDDHLRFHGLVEDNNSDEYIPYYLEFIPLNDIKHLHVFINTDCMISTVTSKNFQEDFEFKNVGMTSYHPTLFELVKTFLVDISFYGNPKSRNIAHENFKESLKNIPPIESFTGVKPGFEIIARDSRSNDEIDLERLQQELYEEQEKENYHQCSLILKDIRIIQARINRKGE